MAREPALRMVRPRSAHTGNCRKVLMKLLMSAYTLLSLEDALAKPS